MKILLISYDYFRYDGRVRELINVAKDLGDVTYITRGDGDEQPQESSISFTKTMDTWILSGFAAVRQRNWGNWI